MVDQFMENPSLADLVPNLGSAEVLGGYGNSHVGLSNAEKGSAGFSTPELEIDIPLMYVLLWLAFIWIPLVRLKSLLMVTQIIDSTI